MIKRHVQLWIHLVEDSPRVVPKQHFEVWHAHRVFVFEVMVWIVILVDVQRGSVVVVCELYL